MIRPRHFTPNPETALDNAFQTVVRPERAGEVAAAAYDEVTRVAERLAQEGVTVHLFDDDDPTRADSVFPNNWFSTHAGGRIAVYPMYAPSRRTERRADVVELLKSQYRVQDVVDYSGLEYDGQYLEGTGAMVLDHVVRVAYTARSNRADPIVLERFCTQFGYEPMVFDATEDDGTAVYHTNVLMCIGTSFALVGLEMIRDERRRAQVAESLAEPGREVLALTSAQVRDFAGNAIELRTPSGRVLALSTRAAASLTPEQRAVIEQTCRIVPLEVPTIEHAGGSLRCMVAGVHLTRRPVLAPVVAEEAVLGG
ncbi:amidinotransferase [Phycicoccus endophyticus]|nr:amidinotransferase [Phycicoccus endophyticus]